MPTTAFLHLNVTAKHTDVQLIEMAKTGNPRAFREIVSRYESQVAGVIYGMLGRGMEADDVGQETFIRFYRSMGDFRAESALGTYLTRIAINLSLNALKTRKRNFRNVDLDSAAGEVKGMGGNEAEERREARELVEKALARMEPKFRSVIVLRMLEGYSTKEAAAILEVPLGTVLSRLTRAQGKLKEILEKLM